MPTSAPSPSRLALFVAALLASAELSHYLSFETEPFATLWLPSGVVVAAFFQSRKRDWGLLAAAAFVAFFVSDVLIHSAAVWQSTCYWAGDMLEATLAAWLFRRFVAPEPDLSSPRAVIGFCVVTALVAAIPSATIGALTLGISSGFGAASFASNWVLWWAADAIGMLVLTPALLAFGQPLDAVQRRRWLGEGPVAIAVLTVVTASVFGASPERTGGLGHMTFWVLPAALWLAVRLSARGASLGMVVIALVSVWGTTRGLGPYASDGASRAQQAFALESFLLVTTCTALALAAAIEGRARAEASLRHSEERLRDLFENVHDLIVSVTPEGRFELVNRAWRTALGYAEEDLARLGLADVLHPSCRAEIFEVLDRVLRGEEVGTVETVFLTKSGAEIPVEGSLTRRMAEEGPVAVRGVFRDITARKQLEARQAEEQSRLKRAYLDLAEIALTDPLTGLRNRRAFEDDLEREASRASRDGSALSLLVVDVDHFKSFNDRFGHPAGDEALREVARLLRESARRSDTVARIGGEEFAVILPETPAEGAVVLADRFRIAIEAGPWGEIPITASFGVSTLHRDSTAETPVDLIRQADRALYRSKRLGRNRVTHAAEPATDDAPRAP